MRYDYYKLEGIEEKIYSYRHLKIFFYPAGDITKEILNNINLDGIDIQIIDRNKITVSGFEVHTIDILKTYKEAVIFITSSKFEQSIRNDIKAIKEFKGIIETAFLDKTELFEDIKEVDKICLTRMDLVVTTRCSLRCEKCANLMQYYEHPSDIELNIIIESMDRLTRSVDFIGTLYVLGGEPFLYKELDKVLCYLNQLRNIGEIKVVTNGTICPSSDNISLWEELHRPNIRVSISDYGLLSKNKNKLYGECKKRHINIEIEENKRFYDTGNMKKRNRTEEQLQTVFMECGTLCRSLFNGEFHYCPRSSHGTDLGIIKKYNNEYVNLFENQTDLEIREEIRTLINRKEFIEACDYCDIRIPGYYERTFPPAVQTQKVLHVEV